MYKIIFLFSLSCSLFAGGVAVEWDSDNKLGNIFFNPLAESIARSKKANKQSGNSSEIRSLSAKHAANNGAYEMVRIFGGCIPQNNPNKEWPCVDSFSIDKTEVTNAMYRKFKPKHNSDSNGFNLNDDNQPVVNVNIDDAREYANWLSVQTGKNYSLPTNIQWQYAALAGGAMPENICQYANIRDEDCNGNEQTSVVASYMPNSWGVYDMFGNVWEMIEGDKDIAKGGSWYSSEDVVNNVFDFNFSNKRLPDIGFRLVVNE